MLTPFLVVYCLGWPLKGFRVSAWWISTPPEVPCYTCQSQTRSLSQLLAPRLDISGRDSENENLTNTKTG